MNYTPTIIIIIIIIPSGPGPLRGIRDLSCFSTVSSLTSKSGAVTLVLSTGGRAMSDFSMRQKKLLSSFGLKLVFW